MKKVLVFFLIFSLLLPFSVSFAKDSDGKAKSCPTLMTDKKNETITKFQDDEANLQESYSIDLLQAIFNSVNLNTLNTLIFGNPYCVWYDDYKGGDLVYGVFTKEQKEKIVDPIFHVFSGTYLLALVVLMIITGLKAAYLPFGKSKQMLTGLFPKFFSTIVLLVGYTVFVGYIFNLNAALVTDFKSLLLSQGIDLKGSYIVAKQDDFNFTDILIIGAEWVLVLFMNFVYIMRSFMVTILMGLGGLAIISLLFDSTRSYFTIWLQDFIGAIFMQSIHALYMTVVLLMVATLGGEGAVLFKLILLILFLPLSSMVLGWLNLSSSAVATATGMQGINSLAKLRTLSSMAKSKGYIGGKSNGADFSQLSKTKISGTASGFNSSTWQSAKSVMSMGGAVAGAAAGSVLGPGGASLGAGMGSKIAPTLIQAPRNLAGGIKGTADTLKNGKKEGFKNIAEDISKKRKFYGDLGESLGSMVGAGGIGRSVGTSLSGVSRQRLLNSTEKGGLGGNTLNSLSTQYPGGKVAFMQTNQGSGFYLNTNGNMVPISPTGAADMSLQNGETRMIDYQFANGQPLQADELGNYTGSLSNAVAEQSNLTNVLGNETSLMRTSEAYISSGSETYNDSRFNASSLTPSDYYRSGMQGAEQRNPSDRVADAFSTKRHPGFV
ncbi:hypothetical protein [Viridibacillus arvi]|uniref:hypothetical protein n=1 Tax=Viridibacillus arvi TaxID=263475 RepID=UPI0034CFC5E9